MAKKNTDSAYSSSGLIIPMTFFIMLVINSAIIYLANMFFPNQVVLGTISMNSAWAILHAAGTLSLVLTLVMPFMTEIEKMKGRALTPVELMVKYYIINFVALWVITRFSDQFGMGISGWYVAAVMALVMDFVQGGVMVGLEKIMGEK